MNVTELLASAHESMTVQRVYGAPLEKDGLTMVPAAVVGGGGGAGAGQDEKGQHGEGGGFGMAARPAGAYVIGHGTVHWQPAVDLNRLVVALSTVITVYLLTRPRILRAKALASSPRTT